jgi:hypothetical protein
MAGETIRLVVVLTVVFGAAVIIPVSIAWFDHRTRTKALDVLRVYAERGEEPPPSVTQALTWVSGWPRNPPEADNRDRIGRPRTRGGFIAHAAANSVFTAGFSGLAWWRVSETGEVSPGVIVAIIVALFFAASLAAQLVGAYYAPDR